MIFHACLLYGMQAMVAQQFESYIKFHPSQKPASFNLDMVMRKLEEASAGR